MSGIKFSSLHVVAKVRFFHSEATQQSLDMETPLNFQISSQIIIENQELQGIAAIDHRTIATCSMDGGVLIWVQQGDGWEMHKVLKKHQGRVRTVFWVKPKILPSYPDGLLLSSGFDKTILGTSIPIFLVFLLILKWCFDIIH